MKVLVIVISVLGFSVFLLPVFTGILNAGNGFGMAFFALLAVIALKWDSLRRLASEHKAARVIFTSAITLAAALFIGALIISAMMIHASRIDPFQPSAVIVLGCKVKDGRPSLMLKKRIDAAYECLTAFPEAVCVVSGGQGADEIISEAECMKNELIRMGISEYRIIEENRSRSTNENIKFSKELLDARGISGEVTIATSEFHQFRASIVAKRNGLSVSAASSRTAWYLLPTYWVRDCAGSVAERFRS